MNRDNCKRVGSIAFRRDNLETLIPNKPGVYIFWSGRYCIYVGQATDLRGRLLTHWRKSHNDGINTWIRALGADLCVTHEVVKGSLSDCEQSYINRYRPHLNKINARI